MGGRDYKVYLKWHRWANIRRSLCGLVERALEMVSEDLGSSRPGSCLVSSLGLSIPTFIMELTPILHSDAPDVGVHCLSVTVPGRRGGVWGRLIWQHYFSPVGSDFLCVCVCGGRWLSPSATALWIHAFTQFSPSTVAPSKPDCAIEGETVIGNNIQLTCQSKEGSPAPQYSWKSYDILNKERPAPAGNGDSRGRRAPAPNAVRPP